MFDVASPEADRLVLQESTSDRARPAVFAFIAGALAMQLLGPLLYVPSHRLRFATLAAALFTGALFLLRPGRFVADGRLGRIESSLGWRSLLQIQREIPFAEVRRVAAVAGREDENEVYLDLVSRERFVVASDLDTAQTEALGRELSALIGVPFEAISGGW